MQLFNLCELKIGKLKNDTETIADAVRHDILDEIGLFFPQFVGDTQFIWEVWNWKCRAATVSLDRQHITWCVSVCLCDDFLYGLFFTGYWNVILLITAFSKLFVITFRFSTRKMLLKNRETMSFQISYHHLSKEKNPHWMKWLTS